MFALIKLLSVPLRKIVGLVKFHHTKIFDVGHRRWVLTGYPGIFALA